MGRRIIVLTALLLWAVLAFLTVYVLFSSGPDVLVMISVLVVALLGVGIFGALGE